jgi:hypothetical protein
MARRARVEDGPSTVTIEDRSLERRKRMVAHRATSFEDAEAWDLDFWQQRTPEERLSALVAIRRDVELVEAARGRRSPEEP